MIKTVEQEYLAYLFLHNSNWKMHSQLKKDEAIDYSKGNTDVYPTDIYKALTLINGYKPLKLILKLSLHRGLPLSLVVRVARRKARGQRST